MLLHQYLTMLPMKSGKPSGELGYGSNYPGLYEAVLTLRTVDDCQAFFEDLCTPAELQAMEDRWAVVRLLHDGKPYREIHSETGVSVTTIGRVARYLLMGQGGYQTAIERLAQGKAQSSGDE